MSQHEQTSQATHQDALTSREFKFTFKSRKLKDEQGREVGEAFKPEPVIASIPVPTAALLIQYLQQPDPVKGEDGKVAEATVAQKVKQLILDTIHALIKDQGKDQLDSVLEEMDLRNPRPLALTDLDFDKLSLEVIALIEPARRGAVALSDDDYNSFFEDYTQVMSQAAGLEEKKIKAHLDIFKAPTKIKSRKDMLEVMLERLAVYATKTSKLEENMAVYARLQTKFDKWFNEEDKIDLAAL